MKTKHWPTLKWHEISLEEESWLNLGAHRLSNLPPLAPSDEKSSPLECSESGLRYADLIT